MSEGIIAVPNPYAGKMGVDSFIYGGTSRLNEEGFRLWSAELLTSGNLIPKRDIVVDIFLVGGGAGSSGSGQHYAGGGGGYTKTIKAVTLKRGVTYKVTIGAGGGVGADGGITSIKGGDVDESVTGGAAPTRMVGGNGGSGGGGGGSESSGSVGANGGSDGSDGENGSGNGGKGQGSTTRAFGDSSGALYAGGGAGDGASSGGTGGDGGGGDAKESGTVNTGGGAGGSRSYGNYGRSGGSGIVIIRSAR